MNHINYHTSLHADMTVSFLWKEFPMLAKAPLIENWLNRKEMEENHMLNPCQESVGIRENTLTSHFFYDTNNIRKLRDTK